MGQLADLLKHNKVELQLRLKHFMQMVVASFESLSQASVQAAPRLFDGNSMSKSVGISQVARNLSKYDGGSDLILLREMPELTTEQQQYLESAAEADWRRPLVPVDDGSGLLPNIFSQPINNLAVAQTPYTAQPILRTLTPQRGSSHLQRQGIDGKDLIRVVPYNGFVKNGMC